MYKEKYIKLVEAIAASKEYGNMLETAFSYLERAMSSFPTYVSSVFNMETAMQTLRYRLEPEDYRAKVVELDRNRKHSHDCAIDSVNGINRMCEKCGVEPFFAGDTSDRIAVAEFCSEVVQELFEKRLSNQDIRGTLQALAETTK